MRYGDYIAKIDYEEDSRLFHGRVLNLCDVVNFYGGSAEDLEKEFRESIEAYLEVCAEEGIEPQKPYSGRFNLRLPAELHRTIAETSAVEGMSLNAWVIEALTRAAAERRGSAR